MAGDKNQQQKCKKKSKTEVSHFFKRTNLGLFLCLSHNDSKIFKHIFVKKTIVLISRIVIITFTKNFMPKKIWSDFDNLQLGGINDRKSQFLDWEYIFDPNSFKDLSGKKWEVFRKNIRKWPRNNPNWVYSGHIDKEE